MNSCQHVVWDWNGTLLDDVQACADAINILLARRSMPPVSLEQYLEVFDFPVRDYYLRLGFDFARENWDQISVEYHDVYASIATASRLRDGAPQALARIRRQGLGLSILSACEEGMLRRMMQERGVLEAFDHVYGLSNLHAHSKLSLGHAFLKETGLHPGSLVLVGDTTHDYEVAQALGIGCILMEGGHQAARKLRHLGCPLVPDVDALLRYLGIPA